jgi:hypothetical protein
MAISNCLFSPISENSCVIPSLVCTCKVKCQPTQLLIAQTLDHIQLKLTKALRAGALSSL